MVSKLPTTAKAPAGSIRHGSTSGAGKDTIPVQAGNQDLIPGDRQHRGDQDEHQDGEEEDSDQRRAALVVRQGRPGRTSNLFDRIPHPGRETSAVCEEYLLIFSPPFREEPSMADKVRVLIEY